MRRLAGRVIEYTEKDPEEGGLEEHGDHARVEGEAVEHLDDGVVCIGRVLLVVSHQDGVGAHNVRLSKPERWGILIM